MNNEKETKGLNHKENIEYLCVLVCIVICK